MGYKLKLFVVQHNIKTFFRAIRHGEWKFLMSGYWWVNWNEFDIDEDEPDQYNVYEDDDGHNCGR